jgi:6-phosphogluconolactonase
MKPSPSVTARTHHLFIGTYTKNESRGIYAVNLDPATGVLSDVSLAAETKHPSFLALSADKKFLYAVSESPPGWAVSFAIGEDRTLRPVGLAPGAPLSAPCHVAVDRTGRTLVLTHYGNGFVASLPIGPDGRLGESTVIQHTGRSVDPERQTSAHVHSATISPDNRHVIVCDLGLDRIFSYAIQRDSAKLIPANPPFTATTPGAGPRHSAFSPDGRHLYVMNEMGGTLSAYAYDPERGALTPLDTQSTLPSGFTGLNTTAEVRVHPNGRFVYGSNRGHDSLAVFARTPETGLLTRVEIVPCGGLHPRNFCLSPDGAWLVCANMNSNSLTVFRVDSTTGRLTRIPGFIHVPMPVCVVFYD